MQEEFAKDYYKFLGVERNASQDSILRAFRQKSRQYHPDKVQGNEELMKLLTKIKVTLLDPDKKEKYDDTYEPNSEGMAEELAEKLYLNSGRKLSESYIEKIKFWKKEINLFDLKDNSDIIGGKWIDLRESFNECPIFKPENHISKEYEQYLNQNIDEDLNSGLKKLFPERVWNLDSLKKPSKFWSKIIERHYENAQEHNQYEKALVVLAKSGMNNQILIKAQELFNENKFNECLLYCRYLMNVNKYCPEPTLMVLKISEKNGVDINRQLLSVAKHYSYEEEIQKLMFEKLIEKRLFIEANNLLDNNPSLKSEVFNKNPVLKKEIKSRVEANNYEVLKELVYKSDFKSTAEFITTHPSSQTAITRIYTELTLGRKLNELPASFRAMLSLLNGCSLLFKKEYIQSFNCFRDALYTFPLDTTLDAVVLLLQSGEYTQTLTDNFMTKLKTEQLVIPTVHSYVEGIKSSSMLRTVVRYEKNIQSNKELSNFQKSMLYIDLCMACAHPLVLANNLCLSAQYLLNCIEDQLTDFSTVYALRNTICDLCSTVLVFSGKYLDPIGITHFCRLTFNLMNKAHLHLSRAIAKNKLISPKTNKTTRDMIDETQQSLFNLLNHLLSKSIKVNPLIQINLTLSADLFFINCVNHEFLEKYYNHMIDNHPKHPLNYLFKYYLFEGHWKGWFDKDSLTNARLICMQSLLQMNNLKINKIENNLKWTAIIRDKNGWINSKNLKLSFPDKSYSSVDGLTLDLENGTFKLHLSSKRDSPSLFCDSDITEVFQNGVTHSLFSLDQADFELNYFPFQQMRYSPKSMENTSYLSTVFHADYLLKMIATDTEVCCQVPFEFRSASNGFLKALPEELRNKLKLSESKDSNFGRTHRFWIEADKLVFNETKVGENKKLMKFTGCRMMIKEHLLTQNTDGEYVDDNEDDDDFSDGLFNISPEKKFAENFTENYDEIGKYFPIFLRLRELLKLNAILGILRGVSQSMEKAKKTIKIDSDKIRTMLRGIRSQIKYPINTNDRVEELFRQTLRENGINEYQVKYSEISRVKGNIRKALADAEDEMFNQVTRSLIDGLRINGLSQNYVYHWIVRSQEMSLVNHLCQLIKESELEKLSKFSNFLRAKKVNLDHEEGVNFDLIDEKANWVPAVFSMSERRKCYGGVCLIPRLSEQNGGNSQGSSGSGPTRFINENHFTVRPRDYDTGQPTSANRQMAADIRAKGMAGDDAGHILAKILGGKMSQDNLFPQNMTVNRGQYRVMENHVKKYLQANKDNPHARVIVEVNLGYRDGTERPFALGYQISFIEHGNRLANASNLPGVPTNPYRVLMVNKNKTEK